MQVVIDLCAAHGMPEDQTRNFAQAGYVVLEQNMDFHAAAREADLGVIDELGLGGTRGAAKSHTVMAQVGLDDCVRFPGLKWLFLRKIMKSAAESLDDLTRKVFAYVPHALTGSGVTLPNTGSRILIGGYKDPSDIDKYLGIEYDGIVIEEATQLVHDRKNKIRGSLRTSKAGWTPRLYMTTNADGPGLNWFKRDLVTPKRLKKETNTRFFDVSFMGNPFIDPAYVKWLMGLKGPLAKAWRDADWDAFAGMAFPLWSYERMVLEPAQTFEIPQHWPKWRMLDWGLAVPFCCLWVAKNPDTKRLYAYREAYEAGLTELQQCELILTLTPPGETISLTYADPALWARKSTGQEILTTEKLYRQYGVPLTRADNNRIQGIRKVHASMADLPDGKPGLQVFYNCSHLIEQVGSLARDERNPEDVDTEQEDHAYDAYRYGLTNERRLQAAAPPAKSENPLNRYGRTL